MFSSSNSHWPGLNYGCHGFVAYPACFFTDLRCWLFWGYPLPLPSFASGVRCNSSRQKHRSVKLPDKNMPNTARLWLAVDLFGDLGFHGCSPTNQGYPEINHLFLVGGFNPFWKNMKVSWGCEFPIYGKIYKTQMFQTINYFHGIFKISMYKPSSYGGTPMTMETPTFWTWPPDRHRTAKLPRSWSGTGYGARWVGAAERPGRDWVRCLGGCSWGYWWV